MKYLLFVIVYLFICSFAYHYLGFEDMVIWGFALLLAHNTSQQLKEYK